MNALIDYIRRYRQRKAERKKAERDEAERRKIESLVNVRVRNGRLTLVIKAEPTPIYIDQVMFRNYHIEDVVEQVTEFNIKLNQKSK